MKIRMYMNKRSEMVDEKNKTTSLKVELRPYPNNICCTTSAVNDAEQLLDNKEWTQDYAEGCIELRVSNPTAFSFFRDNAVFDIEVKGKKGK